MKILEAFQSRVLVQSLRRRIARAAPEDRVITLMEVCGTHTQAIGRWGLRSLLPPQIRLVSGPGCPVCVTPGETIDAAGTLAVERGLTVATFGDLLRVPGERTSLERARAAGADIRAVYSPLEVLELARRREGEVVFLAVGFETTIAGIAAAMRAAHAERLENLGFHCSLKLVPPALEALLADPEVRVDGFLLPGHVSAIIGRRAYRALEAHGVPGAIAGFEPVDILRAVAHLVEAVVGGSGEVANLYRRVVREDGNPAALSLIDSMLEPRDAVWRGIGRIPASGLVLREEYAALDAARRFGLAPPSDRSPAGCACGSVMRGLLAPQDCPLFGEACTPRQPVGPCMVSSEGSCAAGYAYPM